MQQNTMSKVQQSCVEYSNPDYESSEQDCRNSPRTSLPIFQKHWNILIF